MKCERRWLMCDPGSGLACDRPSGHDGNHYDGTEAVWWYSHDEPVDLIPWFSDDEPGPQRIAEDT
jgi:hypothetical protein